MQSWLLELAIYDEQGIEVDRWMSSNEPHVVYGLTEGQSYRLIEIVGPVGYVLMEELSFLAKDGITVTAYNQKARRDLVFTKVDADDETNVLADAEFALYDDADCQHELQRQQSDVNGMVRFTALTYGTYYLKELQAPQGYQLDPEKRVMVLDDAEQQEMSWSNKRKQTVFVQSGDLTNPEVWFLVSACSTGLIFLLFMRKKRNNG